MRMPCQTAMTCTRTPLGALQALWTLLGTLAATSCGDAHSGSRSHTPSLEAGACEAYAEAARASSTPVAALREQGLAAARRLQAGVAPEEWDGAQATMRRLAQAPACAPDAGQLPWQDWIREARRSDPEFATQQLHAAHVALKARALPLALELDQRDTQDGLRLEAHRILWIEDPGQAAARARALLFREPPRAQDRLRPAYVEQILALAPPADAFEIRLAAAADDGMEHRARLEALRALRASGDPAAAPVLESIFIGEHADFIIRRESMMALYDLDRARARQLLARRFPEEPTDPGLREFLGSLRAQEGIVPL